MKSERRSRGVSEVVGYLLVFSIVVTIVSVIYASGMPMVERTKENSVLQSMETVFIALQSNIKKVALAQSPVRTMKLNPIKGSISANKNAGTINITVNGTKSRTIQFGNIEYTLGARKMIYENGAVIESTPGGSIIVSDPPIFFTNSSGKAHVFISVINASGTFSAGGGIAEMSMRQDNPDNDTRVIYNGAADYVNISINSSYAYAWINYLQRDAEKMHLNVSSSHPDPTASFGYVNVSDAKGLNLTLVSHNVTIS